MMFCVFRSSTTVPALFPRRTTEKAQTIFCELVNARAHQEALSRWQVCKKFPK